MYDCLLIPDSQLWTSDAPGPLLRRLHPWPRLFSAPLSRKLIGPDFWTSSDNTDLLVRLSQDVTCLIINALWQLMGGGGDFISSWFPGGWWKNCAVKSINEHLLNVYSVLGLAGFEEDIEGADAEGFCHGDTFALLTLWCLPQPGK